jgi:hypothetical protein
MAASLIVVKECKSAIKKNDSLPAALLISIAGKMAPKMFPKWGTPLLCIPVNILAIAIKFEEQK